MKLWFLWLLICLFNFLNMSDWYPKCQLNADGAYTNYCVLTCSYIHVLNIDALLYLIQFVYTLVDILFKLKLISILWTLITYVVVFYVLFAFSLVEFYSFCVLLNQQVNLARMCCTRPIPVEVHGSLGAQPSVFYSSTYVTEIKLLLFLLLFKTPELFWQLLFCVFCTCMIQLHALVLYAAIAWIGKTLPFTYLYSPVSWFAVFEQVYELKRTRRNITVYVGTYFRVYFMLNWFIFLTIKFPGAKLFFWRQLAFYGAQECIVVFAGAHHWSLSWVRWN